MKNVLLVLFYSFIFGMIVGCGGGGKPVSFEVNGHEGGKVGRFLDSKVTGAYYQTTSGISGKTGENGEYYYNDGDIVEFYVGDIKLGKAKGAQLTTVFDFEEPENVAILLQTLDSDGNPNNGINISEEDFEKLKNSTWSIQEVDSDSSSFREKFKNVMGYEMEVDGVGASEHALNTLKQELIQKIDFDFFQMILNKKLPEKGLTYDVDKYYQNIEYDSNDFLLSYESRLRAYFYLTFAKRFLKDDIDMLREVRENGIANQKIIDEKAEHVISFFTDTYAKLGLANATIKNISTLKTLSVDNHNQIASTLASITKDFILPSTYGSLLDQDTILGRTLKNCTPMGKVLVIDGLQCMSRVVGEVGKEVSHIFKDISIFKLDRRIQARFISAMFLELYYAYDKNLKVLAEIFVAMSQNVDIEYPYDSFDQKNVNHLEKALDVLAKVFYKDKIFATYEYNFDEAKRLIEEYQYTVENLADFYMDNLGFDQLNTLDQNYVKLNIRLISTNERNKVNVCLDITNQSSFGLKSPDGRVKYFLDDKQIGGDSFVLDDLTVDNPYRERCTAVINLSPEELLTAKILRVEYDLNYLPLRMDTSFKKQKGIQYFEISKKSLTDALSKPVIKISAPAIAFGGDKVFIDAIESFAPNGDALSYKWEYIPRSSKHDPLTPYIHNSTSFRAYFIAPVLPADKMRYKLRFKLTVTATNGNQQEKFFSVVVLQQKKYTISGKVTREDGKAISGVPVQFFYSVGKVKKSLSSKTGADGRYSIRLTSTQFKNGADIVYASTYNNSYKPLSKDIKKRTGVKEYSVDFVLVSSKENNVVIDKDINDIQQVVTHLGDNHFGTGVNAQIPKDATSTELTLYFNISADQYNNYKKAQLSYLAQGVEVYGDKIILNDTKHSMSSNSNSEYKKFTISINKSEYHIGVNSLQVVSAKNSSGDFDDFRFTNIQMTFLDPNDDSLDNLLDDIIGDTDTTTKELSVTNFWQSNSSGIYKASCKEYEKIIDAQFTMKNSGNSKIYIEKLALAVHHDNGEYYFDMGIEDVYKWLLVGENMTIGTQGAWLTELGNYQIVAKAYYDSAWHNLSIKNFKVIENPSCNNNQNNNDGYYPSGDTTVIHNDDYQHNNDYDFDADYDGDSDGDYYDNFAPVNN